MDATCTFDDTATVLTLTPGHVRLRVPRLYDSPCEQRRIEAALQAFAQIDEAHASPLTGNVLMCFDPAIETDALLAALGVVRRAPSARPLPARPSDNHLAARTGNHAGAVPAPTPHGSPDDTGPGWYRMPVDTVLAHFASDAATGLSTPTTRLRLQVERNAMPPAPRRSALALYFGQLTGLPVALLGVSALFSLLSGGIAEAVAIVAVLGMNAGIGYASERQSERTIASLSEMIDETVPVLRDGREQEVPTAQIVTGDLLVLRAGVQVAADARLVQQDGLQVDESTLTGESRFVAKSIAPMTHAAPLADRTNMLYMGTAIAAGIGLAVVVATGSRSELGRIQHMVDNTLPPPTPIQRQLDALGNQLVRISTAACVLVFGIGLVRGRGALIMLKASMSLAIAAVPEGLPTVATTAFARGLRIMRAQQMLIRRLKTIETLGAVQTVCFDKTGTLTLNRMSAVALQTPSYRCAAADGCRLLPEGAIRSGLPEEVIRLLEVCVLSRENGAGAQQQPTLSNGSATENALQRMAIDAGIDATQVQVRYPLLHSLLRSERRKYMMTVHAASKSDDESNDDMRLPAHGSHWLAVKGAPLEVLALCSRMHDGARLVLLTPALRAQIVAANADMAARQLRVLGFAWGDVAVASTNIDTDTDTDADDAARSAPHDLVWLGLVGLADPIRPGITEVIRDFHRAGIRTVMITGDQRATAQAVGEQLGLADGRRLQVLDADEFDRIDAALLPARVAGTDVFARVSPGHKLQIVQALQHDGTVVAMTGDGINDGPALRAADVGIAMGLQGTDLARGAAGVVLKDDRLDTLLDAIRQGRTITRNIEKSLEFLISSNLSEILIVLGAIGITASAPLTPIQLLWINLLSDVWPAVALAAEPPDGDVMAQPPRDPRRPLVGREALLRHAREAGWLTAGTLGVYLYAVLRHGAGARASAMMFNAMILGQMLHALSCRSRRPVSLLPRQGRDGAAGMLDRAVTGSVAVQIGANLLPGLSRFLGLGQRIDLVDAAAILGGALLPFVANQVAKADVADSDACPPVGTGPRAVCDGSLSRPGPARSC